MHLAEGILPFEQAVGWSFAGIIALAWSIRGEKLSRQDSTLPSVIMAGVTSLLFAVTLLPLPVPIVGATSHICLTPVLALLIGIRRLIWPTFFVLLLQAIFFAHGGLTTLGLNTLTLGVLGPAVTICLWTILRKFHIRNTICLVIACGVGDLSIYVADAMLLAFALADAVEPMVTFMGVTFGFAPVQVPLAVLEAVVSIGMIRLLAARRPDFLPMPLRVMKAPPKVIVNIAMTLLCVCLFGCDYEGIDKTVFGATATSVGRLPTESVIDLSQGEFGLAMSILILFGLGFIAGRSWERIFSRSGDAVPR